MTRSLLTSDHVAQWRRRLEEIAQEEERLASERNGIERKLDALEVLLGDVGTVMSDLVESQQVVGTEPQTTRSRESRATWPKEMIRVFEENQKPMTYEWLKNEIDKGPLEGEYAKSEKGFYHAISRLQKKGYLAKHKGWLFRTQDLDGHLKRVKAGEISDVDEMEASSSQRRSLMGEEVKIYLSNHPEGTTSGDVIAYLKGDERFVDTLNKNATGAYNVISRLAKRGEIRKEGKKLYPLEENDPPSEGGSEAEGDGPPSDPANRPGFSLAIAAADLVPRRDKEGG